MSINMEKGQKVDLTKENPNLTKILVGLGWDVNQNGGAAFDLDACAILIDKDKKAVGNPVYFNNLTANGVKHAGDNLTGAGDGDDEQIIVNLNEVPQAVDSIIIAVCIYQAASRNQKFGMVDNSFIRVEDNDTHTELARYDLGEDYSTEKSVIAGEIYRHNGEWKFKAVGEGFNGEMKELFSKYNIQ